MLMAILYRNDETIVASALACDQQPFGNRYWLEMCDCDIHPDDIMETVYTDIVDPILIDRLLHNDFRNGAEAAKAVEDYLNLTPVYETLAN